MATFKRQAIILLNMANFWKLVNGVIAKSDILLEVLDARMIDQTRNEELEDKIQKAGKQIIFVINKCDLVNKDELEKEIRKKKLFPSVFISSTEYYGITMLRDKILRYAKREEVIVGVLGYPNTGKSSLINTLNGRASVPVSMKSGFTRSVQLIRTDKRISLLDTPGVIPYGEKDQSKHIMISTIDFTKVKDPEMAAMDLIDQMDGLIEKYYGVEKKEDSSETIVEIALKQKKLIKGGNPNIDLMSRTILRDWQTGKIRK
jgi:hypothetical protein